MPQRWEEATTCTALLGMINVNPNKNRQWPFSSTHEDSWATIPFTTSLWSLYFSKLLSCPLTHTPHVWTSSPPHPSVLPPLSEAHIKRSWTGPTIHTRRPHNSPPRYPWPDDCRSIGFCFSKLDKFQAETLFHISLSLPKCLILCWVHNDAECIYSVINPLCLLWICITKKLQAAD